MQNANILAIFVLTFASISPAKSEPDKITLTIEQDPEVTAVSKFISNQGDDHLIAASFAASAPSQKINALLRVIQMKSGKIVSTLPIDQIPIISPPGTQEGILALPRLSPDIEWSVAYLDKSLTELKGWHALSDHSLVTHTIQGNKGYYAFGSTHDGAPTISFLDDNLNTLKQHRFSPHTPSMFTGAFKTKNSIISLISSENGSTLYSLSKNLEIELERPIDGFGATGVALQDGSYILTYVTAPHMDVILERFSPEHDALWRVPVYTMSKDAVSSGLKLSALWDGVAFAGFNDGQLQMGKISKEGENLQTSSFSTSKLDFTPTPSSLFISTHKNSINAWGLGLSKDTYKGVLYRAEYRVNDQ